MLLELLKTLLNLFSKKYSSC